MGKKKGKKSGEQPEKKDDQAVPATQQADPQGATGGSDTASKQQGKKKQKQQDVKQPEEPLGAVGGAVSEPAGPSEKQKKKQQTKHEQTPPPVQTISEPAGPPQQQKKKKQTPPPVQTISEPAGPSQQQKKKQQTPPPVQTISEPTGPPQQQKKKQHTKHEQTPPPMQTISEPAGLPQQQKRTQQKHKETPPPDQPLPQVPAPVEPPPGFGRGRGRGRGQEQGIAQPERKREQLQVEVGHGEPGLPQQPQAWRHAPPQQATSPPPGMSGPVRSQAAIGVAPLARVGPSPGIRGPSPPQETRPAPGTLVPVMQPPPPSRAVAEITKGIQALRIPTRKLRERCGTKGKPIIVETNHLSLNFNNLKNNILTHYDVTLEPNLPRRLLRPAVELFRQRHYPNRFPAFDGRRNLYSSGELPIGGEISDEVEVLDPESNRNKAFKITIKYASQVDLMSLKRYMQEGSSLSAPQEAIQAIDIVLRNAASFKFVQVGRSFFTPPRDRIIQLGDGMEMWYGFFQSAILGWKPLVNIDVAHKAFPSPMPVPEVLCEILRLRPEDLNRELTVWQKADFVKYIKGLKIDYMLPNMPTTKRTYKVNNIAESAIKQRFELDDGRSISVGEYFAREKRIPLRYPNLPCLHVGSINRPKPIYVPAELCRITKGQVINRKMNENQTSNMIKQAATSTDERKRKIQDALRSVGFNSDESVVQEFGLSVSDRFEKVEARILSAPTLEYNTEVNKGNVAYPVRGVWRPSTFLNSKTLTKWVILSLNKFTRDDEIRRFAVEMQKMGRQLGMQIELPIFTESLPGTRDLEKFFRTMKRDKVELVVVVVPDKGETYSKVKREAEVNVGVLTQCIKGRTMQRMNPATCSNILLKINSKLNGINHTLASVSKPPCLNRPIMIVGADVTHPSPDQTDIPSVAAVCASHDPKAFQYNIQIRLQPPRVEIIEDLQAIMKEQLMFFYRRTKYKPERIIFFRDGVSEGQFAQVLNSEVNAIRRACASLQPDYKPKVTFLVVQKRHHTRFFPTRNEDADGKNRNVPPGTVVDREITHPTEVDFYLVSHASIQGVSRPTKYRLLWNDDDDMTEDEIEAVTYYLCHMFSRCTRSVSYPAPTYNAHLAAYRARVYLEGEKIKLSDLANEQKKCTVLQDIIAEYPMFFV